MSLNGKHVLVTGGSRGIGRAITLKLAEHGVKVAIHYHKNDEAAENTLVQVRERGGEGFIVQADILQPQDINRMFSQVKDKFGSLDIFVNCARPDLATFYHSPMKMTLDHWRAAIDSQAQAFLLGTQQAASLMRDGGRIIAITYSPSGRTGSWQPWMAMGTAKAALESLCRYFAVALGSRGITVNGISPGVIFGEPNPLEGGVLRSLPTAAQEATQNWHESGWTPMKRVGTPDDIANAAMLLCMQEASFITGQIIHVDGGASIMDSMCPLEIQQG
ncbi:Short-chain dehydrogenase/reductase SDR [Trichormus variabilis ATCC 29413]|uniref:Short-chain dehydrogenase/reductase SDR n=2 Tax=Anabaena variabilis TaxID=264691 RepID=Q3MC64_TRIV2|nr:MULTISPECIES: SDR family oxidoreductase [Nostocaceae]ABA21422.1 Short-chain dehydrogenase/reductase SDR [Trichormus variabilis ATCC 29413]MBC1215871.1 SDR family oxidoreductase [Trichormus variabilis ARAD]MBC1258443.1 SDR family oxidoreductase [Trichormus variabilis V5]MBC1269846.1 SDR family oxidoreductase [Trichormus variabilis FSR]MBC1301091.1 SDR family oxidoreductase [Trichormus variabilis N2B]